MENFLKVTTNIKDFRWNYATMLTDEAKKYIVENLSAQIERIAKTPLVEDADVKREFYNTINVYLRDILYDVLKEEEIKEAMTNKVRSEIKKLLKDE